MPQRDNERDLVENRKEKRREIERGDDPEPFFELEPRRARHRICSGASPAPQWCALRVSRGLRSLFH
jgi:hypothetical protein